MRTWLGSIIPFFVGVLLTVPALAEKMAFPDEELARESVLPVFDVPNSVRNRNIVVSNKFEIGGFLGSVTDEAIYSQNQYGLLGTYHFNETHGINLSFGVMGSGTGSYAQTLKDSVQLDLTKTYGPKSYFLGSYQFTAFYGKLSILKSLVVNTHIYGLLGLGTVMYDGLSSLALDFGLGQRFYLTKFLALRFDLKFVRHTGPNPVSRSKAQLATGNLKIGDFETTNYLLTHISGGLVFLF